MKRAAAVIVNYHQNALTEQAIASVLASTGVRARVILIDNDSDGEWARGRYADDSRVESIINRENVGFGAACNQGIERAVAGEDDFVLLLNNDALVEPETIALLMDGAERSGLAAPKILLPDGRIYAAGGIVELRRARCRNRGIYQSDNGLHDAPRMDDFASACALLVSRRALDSGVRFHEPFFLYYEDADFCLKLARRGNRVAYEPRARVTHLESASVSLRPARAVYYDTRNRPVMLWRNGRWWEKAIGTAYWLAVSLTKWLRLAAAGNHAHARALLKGIMDAMQGKMGMMDDEK